MPHGQVRLVRSTVAVFVRMLELVERRVLGVEETSVLAEEMVIDHSGKTGKRESAAKVVRFGHGHLLRTCRDPSPSTCNGDGTPLCRSAEHFPVTVSSTPVYGLLTI